MIKFFVFVFWLENKKVIFNTAYLIVQPGGGNQIKNIFVSKSTMRDNYSSSEGPVTSHKRLTEGSAVCHSHQLNKDRMSSCVTFPTLLWQMPFVSYFCKAKKSSIGIPRLCNSCYKPSTSDTNPKALPSSGKQYFS